MNSGKRHLRHRDNTRNRRKGRTRDKEEKENEIKLEK
jgi:hypothetical protein